MFTQNWCYRYKNKEGHMECSFGGEDDVIIFEVKIGSINFALKNACYRSNRFHYSKLR